MSRHRARPGVEPLDSRLVMSASHPALAAPLVHPAAVAPAFTADDLRAFADAYLSSRGDSNFNPAYDVNHNGKIGQGDALPILRALAPISPRVPPRLELALAPGDQVSGHHPANSGGVTRKATVTIIGRTTPNAIVFLDQPTPQTKATTATGNFRFQGGALVSDSQGYFAQTIALGKLGHSGSLTNNAFLVKDPFGRHMERAFPVLRIR